LRWNPVLEEWVIVASHRQDRPLDSEGGDRACPFCVGSAEVLSDEGVVSLPNKFASLRLDAPKPSTRQGFYRSQRARGACEVIIETVDHGADLADLSVDNIASYLSVFAERYRHFSKVAGIKYVFGFRNRGREIGVTLDHPHSQLYALPFVPPLVERELSSSRSHWRKAKACLFCKVLKTEVKVKSRIVSQNKGSVAFLPFYARWPYEIHVMPRTHVTSLAELDPAQLHDFAATLKEVLMGYNALFESPLPYIMVVHQAPVDKSHPYYHLHIEFYPPHRSKTKLKYPAGIEQGAGTFTYDGVPEEKAKELREACRRASSRRAP
jgi:UDPglucose--hexose-1-phosphate uridylyltransferase